MKTFGALFLVQLLVAQSLLPPDVASQVDKVPVGVPGLDALPDVSETLSSACARIHSGKNDEKQKCVDNLGVKAGLIDLVKSSSTLKLVLAALPVSKLADLDALVSVPLPQSLITSLVSAHANLLEAPNTDSLTKLVDLGKIQQLVAAQLVTVDSLSPEKKADMLLSNSLLKLPGAPGVPSVGMPGVPSLGMPGVPSLGMPGVPSLGMPGVPSLGIPGVPSVGMPGVPSLGMPGVPSLGMPGVPSVGMPGVPSVGMPGVPSLGIPGVPSVGNAWCTIFGNAWCTIFGNARCTIFGNAWCTICWNARCTICWNARCTICWNAWCTICWNAWCTICTSPIRSLKAQKGMIETLY
uniref:Uncharacterized protein n=1 Tax=Acartia pacifica TaxID=335913 RepID=R9TI48_ACAPC|nr:hypothetical protein [Acartia pacifica]